MKVGRMDLNGEREGGIGREREREGGRDGEREGGRDREREGGRLHLPDRMAPWTAAP